MFIGTKRKWALILLLLGAFLLLFTATTRADSSPFLIQQETLDIPRGESLILPVFQLERVAVADPAIADVLVINEEQVLINGKAVGTTTLQIWEKAGHSRYRLRVTPNTDALTGELEKKIGLPGISAYIVNDNVVLDGIVQTELEKERALKLAEAYGKTVIDLLQVAGQPADERLGQAVAGVLSDDRIEVRVVNGYIVLEGKVDSEQESRRAEALAGTFDRPVLNLLEVQNPQVPPEELAAQIAGRIHLAGVSVQVIRNTILLEGTVSDVSLRERAEAIAAAYGKKVVNLIRIQEPPAKEEADSEQGVLPDAVGSDLVPVREKGNGERAESERQEESDSNEKAEQGSTPVNVAATGLTTTGPGPNDEARGVTDNSQEKDGAVRDVVTTSAEENYAAAAAVLAEQIGDSAIEVQVVADTALLEGTVSSFRQVKRAVAIAQALGYDVVNLLEVKEAPEQSVEKDNAASSPGAARGGRDHKDSPGESEKASETSEQGGFRSDSEYPEERGKKQPDSAGVEGEAVEPAALVKEILEVIDDPAISARLLHGVLLLEGEVESEFARQRAQAIAGIYPVRVINLIRIREGENETERRKPAAVEELNKYLNDPQIVPTVIGSTVILEGKVTSLAARRRAVAIAEALGLTVIDLLEVEPLRISDSGKESPDKPAEVAGSNEAQVGDKSAIGESDEKSGPVEEDGDTTERVPGDKTEAVPERDEVRNQLEPGEGKVDSSASGAEPGREPGRLSMVAKQVPGSSTAKKADTAEAPLTDNRPAGRPAVSEELIQEINEAIGDGRVKVWGLNGFIILEGQVTEEFYRLRAEKITRTFTTNVLNLIRVQAPSPQSKPHPPAVDDGSRSGTGEASKSNTGLFLRREAMPNARGSLSQSTMEEQVQPQQDKSAQRPGRELSEEGTEPAGTEKGDRAAGQKQSDPRELVEEIAAAINLPSVQVRLVRGAVVLEGTVASEKEAAGAAAVAGLFGRQVVNRLRVASKMPESGPSVAEQVSRLVGLPGVQVKEVGDQLLLEGVVTDQRQLARAISMAQAFGKETINFLTVERPLQVLLKVKVVEIDRVALQKLGINWGSLEGGVFVPDMTRVGEPDVGDKLQRLLPLGGKIEALLDTGDARLLAAPGLLVLSGSEAEFLAGGEIPVAVPQDGGVQIAWKEYGVKLKMLPEVVGEKEVEVLVRPEVSTLDWANAIRIDSLVLPAMKTRRTETSVRVRAGTTFVIGGLLQNETSRQVHKLPLLGDLPILGKLFRSEQFKRSQTELLFFVTPQILQGQQPVPAREIWPDMKISREEEN